VTTRRASETSRQRKRRPPAATNLSIDPADSAEAAGLLYVSDTAPGITRRNAGGGFRYLGTDSTMLPLERGIAQLVVADLGKVHSLKLLEREEVQALVDEMRLAESGRPMEVLTHPLSAYAGAIGAALWGAFRRRKLSAGAHAGAATAPAPRAAPHR